LEESYRMSILRLQRIDDMPSVVQYECAESKGSDRCEICATMFPH